MWLTGDIAAYFAINRNRALGQWSIIRVRPPLPAKSEKHFILQYVRIQNKYHTDFSTQCSEIVYYCFDPWTQ